MAKTMAERMRDSENRKKARGMVRIAIWGYPEDRPAVREYGKLLTRKRELDMKTRKG